MQRLIVIFIILFTVPAFGQVQGSVKPKEDKKFTQPETDKAQAKADPTARLPFKELQPKKHHWSIRINFVVDVSGSMKRDTDLVDAFKAVRSVTNLATDELEVAVTGFGNSVSRWAGIVYASSTPVKRLPPGWSYAYPMTIDFAVAWLQTLNGGGTNVVSALEHALMEKRDALTVVLVTDGGFNETNPVTKKNYTMDEMLAKIDQLQRKRIKAGLDKALITVYGAGEWWEKLDDLTKLAKHCEGGLLVNKSSTAAAREYFKKKNERED